MSPLLAGRFFTTEPPGKPLYFFCEIISHLEKSLKKNTKNSLLSQLRFLRSYFATFALWVGHLCPLHPSFLLSKIEMDQKTSRLPSIPNVKEISKTAQCMVITDRLSHWHVRAEDHGECPRNSTLSMLTPVTVRVCHLPSLSQSLLL